MNTSHIPTGNNIIGELTVRPQGFDTLVTKLVDEHAKQWKNGAKLQPNSASNNKLSIIQEDSDVSYTLKILLDAILLEDDDSLNDIMRQLQKVSTFQSLLYKELEKISVIHSSRGPTKTKGSDQSNLST